MGTGLRTPVTRSLVHFFDSTPIAMASEPALLIGLVSISDRASAGVYVDKGLPGLTEWFTAALKSPWSMAQRLIPDEQQVIERTLVELADIAGCHLVLTTGGTGPAPRDVTPEATLAIAHKVLPGFGEQMRQVSLRYVPTAILSRQVGVIRGQTLILNLPGQPKAIKETLDGVFPAVPYCIDLIGGPYIETNDDVCRAFRPKSAVRPVSAEILTRSPTPARHRDRMAVSNRTPHEAGPAIHEGAAPACKSARPYAPNPGGNHEHAVPGRVGTTPFRRIAVPVADSGAVGIER